MYMLYIGILVNNFGILVEDHLCEAFRCGSGAFKIVLRWNENWTKRKRFHDPQQRNRTKPS